MEAVDDRCRPEPDDEVDEVRWVALDEARGSARYAHDRALVGRPRVSSARGRHDPLRGQPDPPDPRGRRPRRDRARRTRASRATAGRSASPAARSTRVDAHGKHLFLRFEGDLSLHSHLRMTGAWGVPRRASAGARSPRRRLARDRARGDHEVVQFDGPVLELMTESRTRFDQRLAALGPDILARRARRGARSCAGCARTTRRGRSATRCSTSARSPASATCGRPRAAGRRGSIPGGRRRR